MVQSGRIRPFTVALRQSSVKGYGGRIRSIRPFSQCAARQEEEKKRSLSPHPDNLHKTRGLKFWAKADRNLVTYTKSSSPNRNDRRESSGTRPTERNVISRPRVIDARSLAASRSGAPGPLLRAPKLSGLRGPQFSRTRRPGPPGAGRNSKTAMAANRGRRRQRRRMSDEEEGDDVRGEELEAVFREQRAKEKQTTVRYNPTEYDVSKLRETWPSLPVGPHARAGSVLEKLSQMSKRYPNGYEAPYLLARRLFDGERILFANEKEKEEVMEEVKKLAQERADKLTQRKGEMVDPEDTSFVSVSQDERDALVGQLVQGTYTPWEHDANPSVIQDVRRNLHNNETYQTAGKRSEFLTKLESLLSTGQRVKQA